MQGPSASRHPSTSFWWTAALILGLSLACYWPALRGGMLWDDDAHVTQPELRSLAGLRFIWTSPGATQQYYPLLHSAFWVEHRLWGGATLGYHLVNLLFHATAAVLLVLALRRLKIPGASLAGVLFAVHPVCVESVAWISEQKNTLSLVFYLLAAIAYLAFDEERGRPGAALRYVLFSLGFVLALLTKSVTATLPAALLVVLWWKHGGLSWRRDVVPLLPWFVVALAGGLFTAMVERKLIGAQGADFDLTLLQRCLLAGRAIGFYLGKLLWPTHLVFIYPRWQVTTQAAGWAGYLAAAILVTVVLWLLRRRTRGPLAAWLFFVGSLFPALGFFNVYPFLFSYVADHFQYLASIGVLAGAAAGFAHLLSRCGPALRAAAIALAAAGVGTLAVLSNAQSRIYVDSPALYTSTLQSNPSCWMAHNNLGIYYQGRGDLSQAVTHFREAIRLKGDYAIAHNNLGNLLLKFPGRSDQAMAQIQEALRLRPDLAQAHNNLGVAYAGRGDSAHAIAEYREALRLRPDYPEAHDNLGILLGAMPGRLKEAIGEFEEALRLDPDFPEAHNNLGTGWLNTPGRLNDAIAEYREALRLRPDYAEAHGNLGLALAAQGRTEEALLHYRQALRLSPHDTETRLNLALALLGSPGGKGQAREELEALLRIQPDNEKARQLLAQIRAAP